LPDIGVVIKRIVEDATKALFSIGTYNARQAASRQGIEGVSGPVFGTYFDVASERG
jgi:hypothetical protein